MATSTADIDEVLLNLRDAIDTKMVVVINRRKNLDTLARLGILWADAIEEIYELTNADYISGPETDNDRPNSDLLWVFKKHIFGEIIYIKFKIQYKESGDLKVLSFHIDNIQ